MTNRDRDSVAKLIRQVAARLAAAPASTKESADRYERDHPGGGPAHQAGSLEQVCRNEATALEGLIAEYLSPPKPRARGKR